MISNCPVCGKAFDVLWPQLWRYKENGNYICTWKCLRQLRKEAEEMGKFKKDGTPAKKPGPKPKNTVNIEDVKKDKEIADKVMETVRKEMPKPGIEYKVTGIDTAIGSFQYFKSNQYLDWTDLNGETVSMNLEEWKEFMKTVPEAIKVLGVEL